MKSIDIYDFKSSYKFKAGDKVVFNRKIFKRCPFDVDEIKNVGKVAYRHIGIEGRRMWWNWWEIVPVNRFKKIIYWIEFWFWYQTKFKKLK